MKRTALTRRYGMAALWAVLVLAFVGTMVGWTTKLLVSSRQQRALHEERRQVIWLARSGLELACARLLADPTSYKGETVELIPRGQVEVKVEPDTKEEDVFRVTSTGRFQTTGQGAATQSLVRRARRIADKGGVRLELKVIEIDPPKE